MNEALTQFEHDLPIARHRDEIIRAVETSQVTIITAETGAGKSTQVPQYLAAAGYTKVIVTQPRILAARTLCQRVREEYGNHSDSDATSLIGYRTAHERDDDPRNVILYCTDGLQLVRELTGSGTRSRQILILDEVHEWNENIEVLVAWAKKRCQSDPTFKIVLMSATIDAGKLRAYFDAPEPIVVSGRTFPVEKRHGGDVVAEITRLVDTTSSNILVFLPGKTEIENVAAGVRAHASRTLPIIALHGQLEPALQQRAFESYPDGKLILATNVAQTSITIDDIDVVIDAGLERRSEVRNGVEGLFIAEISQADCAQRAGRAGRTKPGTYILASLGGMPCSKLADRPEFGLPEIMRTLIDRVVLRLASIEIDIEDLEFFHAPSRKTIRQAKSTLQSLGALSPSGEITDIGQKMERFPVASSYARMLVEASTCSPTVQAQLAAIIAIQEVNGIVKSSARYTGWRKLTRQTRSDLLAQYDVYLALPLIDPERSDDLGIIAKNVTKAGEVMQRLDHDLGLENQPRRPVGEEDLEPLLRCIVAGQLDQMWLLEMNGDAVHIGTKAQREVSSGSVVKNAKLIVGTPFDLEVTSPKGLEVLHLLQDITAVNPRWLGELAPKMFKVTRGKVYYDSQYQTLAVPSSVTYQSKTFKTASTPLLDHSPENVQLFIALYGAWLHEQLIKERKVLQLLNGSKIPEVTLSQVQDRVREIAGTAVSLIELSRDERQELARLGQLETYLGSAYRTSLRSGQSLKLPKHAGRRTGWVPPHKRGRKSR